MSLIRQLIRAAKARQQFYDGGRLPEFSGDRPNTFKSTWRPRFACRQGETEEAAACSPGAEPERPACREVQRRALPRPPRRRRPLGARCWRSSPRRESTIGFPWITSDGSYSTPSRSPLDVLWRRCQIQATACSEGIVYVPQLYAGTFRAEDESLRLRPKHGVVRARRWTGAGGRSSHLPGRRCHPPLRGDPEPGD